MTMGCAGQSYWVITLMKTTVARDYPYFISASFPYSAVAATMARSMSWRVRPERPSPRISRLVAFKRRAEPDSLGSVLLPSSCSTGAGAARGL